MSDYQTHSDAAIDWTEATRFDTWIRFNTEALRRKISAMQEKEPWRRNQRGIMIASQIYWHTRGAPVVHIN